MGDVRTIDLGALPEPTLALCARAARALGQKPGALRSGAERPQVTKENARALLETLGAKNIPAGAALLPAGQAAAEGFFDVARAETQRAAIEAIRQAQGAGVAGVMQRRAGGGPPLGRTLSRLDPHDFRALYCEMPVGEATEYLMLKSVTYHFDHLEDILRGKK